ncbi:hypothetical protein IJT10_08575 [bacterium]|nr:hypothetical protein [bacterium]
MKYCKYKPALLLKCRSAVGRFSGLFGGLLVVFLAFILFYVLFNPDKVNVTPPEPAVTPESSQALRDRYANLRVGEYFEFGTYPQGDDGEIKPIKWLILKRDSDSILVISEFGLDSKLYNDRKEEITWSDCTLRRWLNHDFINEAFDSQEQSLIETSYLTNNAGPSTKDRIFLLSVEEAKELFDSDDDRICYYTDYVVKNGVVYNHGAACWWLRSRGDNGNLSACCYGPINEYGCNGDSYYCSVRPALRLAIYPEPAVTPDPSQALCDRYVNLLVGEYFEFGTYPQGSDGEIKAIRWRILERDSDNNSILVISELGLDCKRYNEEKKEITWADCTLRHWLNDDFYNRAFNSQEQSLIKTSNVTNNAGPSTNDRIFLLSVDEAERLFKDDKDRFCKPTDYAVKNGAYVDDSSCKFVYKGNTCWWLRSICYSSSDYALGVFSDGDVLDYGFCVNNDGWAIRPALRLAI